MNGEEDRGGRDGQEQGDSQGRALLPEISVPKGGGAIASIGEKFQVSPATGTGSMSVPIAMSPGRGGFGPSLALSYDSGAGNGPFGLGWSIGLPSIRRKTQRGLPRYRDASESDTFVLAGAEDLVPAIRADGTDDFVEDPNYSQVDGEEYRVRRYRPRIEGLFARIEKWVRRSDGDIHWRMITGDNVTTIFGQGAAARVHWPDDQTRTFEWFIERTYDDKGNIVVYEFERESDAGVANEQHETRRLVDARAFSQTYLKRVSYGNSLPYLVHLNREGRSVFDEAAWSRDNAWYFELVLDYGGHTAETPSPNADEAWPARRDPFSSYRAGFEVRTYRLCRRILMFHRFDDEPMLVRSTDLHFDGSGGLGNPVATQLVEASHTAYEPGFPPALSPGVRFSYSAASISSDVSEVSRDEIPTVPDGQAARWIDLLGEGLSGVLNQVDGAWFYQRNAGDGQFDPPAAVASMPSIASSLAGGSRLGDVDSSGSLNLITTRPGVAGSYEIDRNDIWQPLVAFEELPNIDWQDPNLRMIDVTGDGLPDLVISEDTCFRFYPSIGREGYDESETVAKPVSDEHGPAIIFAESGQAIVTADMSGDGLTDIVRVREGQVCYWPNTGYGTFGAKVTMSDAPFFDDPTSFDPARLRVGDVDGSGAADLIYLGARSVRLWINQSGNRFGEEQVIAPFPLVDNLASVDVLDLLGSGTAALVWTSSAPADASTPIRYLPLMSEGKPYLLNSVDNGMGAVSNIHYAPSTRFYLDDRRAGRPWITKLPFPVQVVERVESIDRIRGNRFVSRSAYHHGAYDGIEREFRGFGMVETWDTEDYDAYEGDEAIYVPPVHTKTWLHTGGFFDRHIISRQFATEYYASDPAWQLPDTKLPPGLDAEEQREACRALKGRTLRSEVYALDGSDAEPHPYAVTEAAFHIRLEQPRGDRQFAVFFVCDCESLSFHYERNPDDPRIGHAHTLKLDRYGRTVEAAAIAYPRNRPEIPEQGEMHVTTQEASFIDLDSDPWTYRTGLPFESKSYEVQGLSFAGRWEKPDLIEAIHPPTGPDRLRLLGRKLVRYFRNSLDASNPAPLGAAGTLGVPFEQYRLVFDSEVLAQPELGGRITPALLSEGGYRNDIDGASTWWIPSGHPVFPSPPQTTFYQPLEARDPFGTPSSIELDSFLLFPVSAFDAFGNETSTEIDYRVLAPRLVTGINGNRVEVVHDTRGMVIALHQPRSARRARHRVCGCAAALLLLIGTGSTLRAESTAAAVDCGPAQTRLRSADDLRVHGAYRQAATEYERLRACEDSRNSAILGLAECRIATGEYAAARELLEPEKSHTARSAKHAMLLADVKQHLGEYESAIEDARTAVKLKPRSCPARLLLAELLEALGRHEEATAEYAWFERLVLRQLPIRADELTAAAVGFYRYSVLTRDANLTQRTRHVLTQMLQPAYERLDNDYWPARIAAADLLREKYNVEDAREDYEAALAINTNSVAAHVGIGRLALANWAFEEIDERVAAALAVNTNSVAALNLCAAGRILERKYTLAVAAADQALAINPHDIETLALKASGLIAIGRDDEANALMAHIRSLCPQCPKAYAVLGDTLTGLRRFAEAEQHYRIAIKLDPTASAPRADLGMMYMQFGDEAKARDALERAWKLDPFNDRTKNMLDLLDRLDRFAEIGDDRFAIRYDAAHDEVIATQFAVHLAGIYDVVCADFDATLGRRTIVEVFPSHTEFGIRIHGKPWIHTIGACTGWVIAMDAPRTGGDLPGPYNFAQVLTHEFTHTVTLAVTRNRIPHWFTEGLAVLEERTARSYAWKVQLADAVRRSQLYTLDDIDWGFMRPAKPGGRQQAYAQSEWMCEYLSATYGADVINRMLRGYAAGKSQPQVFQEITGGSPHRFDQRFVVWAAAQAKGWGFDLTPPEDVEALRAQVDKSPEDAALVARLAAAEIDAESWEKAKATSQRCLALDDHNRSARESLVRVLQHEIQEADTPNARRALEDEAVPIAEELLADDPQNRYALSLLAATHLRRKEVDKATSQLRALNESWPSDPFAAQALASIYYEKDEFDAALPYLLKAAADDTHNTETFQRIGDVYERASQLPDARTWYARALHADPLNENAHLRLAEVAMRLSDLPAAIKQYRVLCKIAPQSAKYHERCALAYRKQGNREQMRTFAKRAVELEPASSATSMLSE